MCIICIKLCCYYNGKQVYRLLINLKYILYTYYSLLKLIGIIMTRVCLVNLRNTTRLLYIIYVSHSFFMLVASVNVIHPHKYLYTCIIYLCIYVNKKKEWKKKKNIFKYEVHDLILKPFSSASSDQQHVLNIVGKICLYAFCALLYMHFSYFKFSKNFIDKSIL